MTTPKEFSGGFHFWLYRVTVVLLVEITQNSPHELKPLEKTEVQQCTIVSKLSRLWYQLVDVSIMFLHP